MKCSHCGREITHKNELSFAEANFGSCFDCEDVPLNFNLDCLLSEHDLCKRWHVSRQYLADLRRRGVGPDPVQLPLGDLLFCYSLERCVLMSAIPGSSLISRQRSAISPAYSSRRVKRRSEDDARPSPLSDPRR
jgi:hypothetical protein